jgi:hypothetical protein
MGVQIILTRSLWRRLKSLQWLTSYECDFLPTNKKKRSLAHVSEGGAEFDFWKKKSSVFFFLLPSLFSFLDNTLLLFIVASLSIPLSSPLSLFFVLLSSIVIDSFD